jgi:hypothetical protein
MAARSGIAKGVVAADGGLRIVRASLTTGEIADNQVIDELGAA